MQRLLDLPMEEIKAATRAAKKCPICAYHEGKINAAFAAYQAAQDYLEQCESDWESAVLANYAMSLPS